ncbi:MAG: hypothetical protein IBJ01_06840 [Leptospira sp.]|nr:hypothetical protein [Leptospira sp.]
MKKIFKAAIKKIMRIFLGEVLDHQYALNEKIENLQISIGELHQKLNQRFPNGTFAENGYKVFSQWNEDGLIQYLINKIPEIPKSYIEFGVENYSESNTRFLMMNQHWKGLIIDGSKQNIEYVKRQNYFWQNSLTAVNQFINKDNINQIFESNGFTGQIGILSIDIDGNDYWILDSIQSISPIIIILEFNNLFGKEKKVTIPYEEKFYRFNSHFSGLYYGASLPALTDLCAKKGYEFVGTNNICNNAFFVRKDFSSRFQLRSVSEVFMDNPSRESRDKNGNLTYLSVREEQLRLISELSLLNLETGKEERIKDLYLS